MQPPIEGAIAAAPRRPAAAARAVRRAARSPYRTLLRRLRGYPSERWLQKHGLTLGRDVYIDDFAAFDHGFLWLISIDDEAVLSAGVRIVAHDGATKHWTGYIRVGRVHIGRRAYIGAHSLLLPGVTVGDHAIVGAGSVVRDDVRPNAIVMGNPAVEVGTLTGFTDKHRRRLADGPCYPRAGFSGYDHVTAANMARMRRELAGGCGYVE